MQTKFFKGLSPEGFHTLAYQEWGHRISHKPSVVCVHGLTRNKADFAPLAETLCKDFHVVSLDVVGRGESDWFQDSQHYSYEQYIQDSHTLFSHLNLSQVFWIGTSMGGLIGMMLASLPHTPLQRIILNDIGPQIPKAAIDRIKSYAGKPSYFKSYAEGATALKTLYAPFGHLEEKDWDHLIRHTLIQTKEGLYTIACDSRAAEAIENKTPHAMTQTYEDAEGNVTFWHFWDKIHCPILVLNGENSDILPSSFVEKMRTRGPSFDYSLVKEAGHAPALMDKEQRTFIHQWLLK